MAADVATDEPAMPLAETDAPADELKPKGKKTSTLSGSATVSFFRSAKLGVESTAVPQQDAGAEEGGASQLSTTPKRRRAPGARWDGRASSASQQEWRESRWSLEAAYQRTMHRSPSYTCRALNKGPKLKSNIAPEVFLNVERSFNYVRRSSPQATFGFSLSSSSFQREQDLAPGPIYAIPCPIDSTPHPLYKNAVRSKFGTETLPQLDQASPGPGAYSLEKFRQDSRHSHSNRYTIRGRDSLRDLEYPPAEFNGCKMAAPAPGDYKVAAVRPCGPYKSVSWTIPHSGDRTNRKVKDTDGSGPGAYETMCMSRSGTLSSPSYSMQGTNPAAWRRAE